MPRHAPLTRTSQSLAPRSKNGKVKVVAHSQGGGLNVPWAT
jgi:hypothetical protein